MSTLESQIGKMRDSIKEHEKLNEQENQRIRQIELQNEKLRKEKLRLLQENSAPMAESISQIPEVAQLQRTKELFEQKNSEIEQLIRQVIRSEQEQSSEPELDQESLDNLLRYLIYIVLDKEDGPVDSIERAENARRSLLDLLKSNDNLRNSLFGLPSADYLSKEEATALARKGLQ